MTCPRLLALDRGDGLREALLGSGRVNAGSDRLLMAGWPCEWPFTTIRPRALLLYENKKGPHTAEGGVRT